MNRNGGDKIRNVAGEKMKLKNQWEGSKGVKRNSDNFLITINFSKWIVIVYNRILY